MASGFKPFGPGNFCGYPRQALVKTARLNPGFGSSPLPLGNFGAPPFGAPLGPPVFPKGRWPGFRPSNPGAPLMNPSNWGNFPTPVVPQWPVRNQPLFLPGRGLEFSQSPLGNQWENALPKGPVLLMVPWRHPWIRIPWPRPRGPCRQDQAPI